MKRVAVIMLAVACAAGAGCGESESDGALAAAQKGLGTIKRGELTMRLTGAAGASGQGEVGFALQGPFDLSGKEGELPKARLQLTRVGPDAQETTFVSTGARAWVVSGSKEVELTGEQLESVRLKKGSEGVAGLHLEDWAEGSVKTSDGGSMDGVAVERLDADVDPVKALNDVFVLAGQFGSGVGPIEGKAAERLREAARSAKVSAWVGEDDDLLRKLTLDVVLAPEVDQSVREALGPLAAARLRLDLAIAKPNQPIGAVDPP